MIEVKTIVTGLNLAKSVAEYTKIIDSMNQKIDRLVNSEFEAAIRLLDQAIRSENEQVSLLRDARYSFNKSISLESGERLALSYLGLAICHYYLNDKNNAEEALKAILDINRSVRESVALDTLIYFDYFAVPFIRAFRKIGLTGAADAYGSSIFSLRVTPEYDKVRALQESIRQYLESNGK